MNQILDELFIIEDQIKDIDTSLVEDKVLKRMISNRLKVLPDA